MRTASSALLALINGGNRSWVKADLYTFYDYAGNVLGRYTNAGGDLKVNGNLFSAGGPAFKRGGVKTVVGTEVDTLNITLSATPDKQLAGVPWITALRTGMLDGGHVLLERFLSDAWTNTSVGSLVWFGGLVGAVTCGRLSATIPVKSDLSLLNIQMPRELFQTGCLNAVFDAGCTLNKGSYAVNGAVGGGSSLFIINSALAQAAGYFDQGEIVFTSGVNNGTVRSVKQFSAGAFTLVVPLWQACSPGDTFTAYPGCDRTSPTCSGKFGNLVNFRATPDVPVPETLQ